MTKADITVPVLSSGDGVPEFQNLGSRRDKGISLVNLEREGLGFYREVGNKAVATGFGMCTRYLLYKSFYILYTRIWSLWIHVIEKI